MFKLKLESFSSAPKQNECHLEYHQHFRTNSSQLSPNQATGSADLDASCAEFEQNFKKSLLKLEQSMKRSEESRMMLGEQRSTISDGVSNMNESRSQLLSFMTNLNNTTL
jgi:flagellar hook-basal body complex protein FliE